MGEYALGRYSGDQRGRLDISTALLASETGWVSLQSRWDMARLRLLGSILCAHDDSPMRLVATALASETPLLDGATPARRWTWNWVEETKHLLQSLQSLPAERRLNGLVQWSSLRFHEASLSEGAWRRRVRGALLAADGRDAAAWHARIGDARRAPTVAASDVTRLPASGPLPRPSPDVKAAALAAAPAVVSTHATAAWLATFAAAEEFQAMGSLPLYRRIAGPDDVAARDARCRLRTASYALEGDASQHRAGLLWGDSECIACGGQGAAGPCAATLDTWHRITECRLLRDTRLVALRTAAGRARARPAFKSLAPVLDEVAAAVDSPAGRAFVFLATLGCPLPKGSSLAYGLPQSWAACLAEPAPTQPKSRRLRLQCAAAVVTLPACGNFARRVAGPRPVAVDVPPPPVAPLGAVGDVAAS